MKVNKLNEDFIHTLNESASVSEAQLLVQNYLWNQVNDFINELTMNVVTDVPEYNPDWNVDILDPSAEVELKETKQQLVEVLMRLLFAYASEDKTVESYDKNGRPEKCPKCNTLLNDMGTCPKCDDGEEDYEDKLDEEVLTEGPLKDIIRGIQNKVDPKGAKNRAEKDARKEVDKAHEKAEVVLSKDFDPKNKDAKFYKPGARDPMDWKEWCETYSGDIDVTDKRYAEWYNAVVTTPDGYFIRRGAEDLSRKLLKRIPGSNDTPTNMYRFDPSTVKDTKEDEGTEEDQETSQEQTTEEEPSTADTSTPEDGGEQQDGTPAEEKEEPVQQPTNGQKIQITNRDVRQLKAIAAKGALTIVDSKGNKLNANSIEKQNLANYQVSFGRKAIPMATWMEFAKKNKIIENLARYCNNINESLLTEAPAIKLTPDQLMNPDAIDFKQIAKDAADKEAAAEVEKANAEKVAKWKAKSIEVIEGIEQFETLEDKLDYAHTELVPNTGKAETVAGEMIRAIVRIIYRDRNDGDKFFEGYGLETCGSSAQYLYDNGFDDHIDEILDRVMFYADNDDAYSAAIEKLSMSIINTLLINTALFTTLNTTDSREMPYEYIEEHQPEYEYELESSDELYDLVNKNIVDSWQLINYVNDQLRYTGYTEGAECARPWSHHDTTVTITNLTKDGYEYCKNYFADDIDAFWKDLVDEYRDELDNDEEEEEFEESLQSNMNESFDFITGADVIDGINGNMSELKSTAELKKFNTIARKFGLNRADDVICFVDTEWMFDPTYFDTTRCTISEGMTEYEVDGIRFFGEVLNGNLWLYFSSETDGNRYLNYANENM